MKKYEILEHTADIRVKIYGRKIEELFRNSAIALFDLIGFNKSIKPKEKKEIKIEAKDLEELLINWLNELIYIFYTYKFLPVRYGLNVYENNVKKLNAVVFGCNLNSYKNINTEIKAATYCDLKIKKLDNHFEVEVVFDV